MKFKYDSNVHNTLDVVWAFITDFNNRKEWMHFVHDSFVTHQADKLLGTRYKEKSTFLGIPLFMEYEVFEFKEKDYFKAKSKKPPFYPLVHCVAKDNGDGTIYSCLEFEMNLGAFALIPKNVIQKQIDNLLKPSMVEYSRRLDLKPT